MTIDYDRLRELADTARPGPWEVKAEETSDCGDLIEGLAAWVEADNERVFGCGMEIEEDKELTNLALAALAPDMAAELLRLRRELTNLRDLIWIHAGHQRAEGYSTPADWAEYYANRLHRIVQGDTK